MSVSIPSAQSAETTQATEMVNNWAVKVIAPDGTETELLIPDKQVEYFVVTNNNDAVSTALWLAYAGRWAEL